MDSLAALGKPGFPEWFQGAIGGQPPPDLPSSSAVLPCSSSPPPAFSPLPCPPVQSQGRPKDRGPSDQEPPGPPRKQASASLEPRPLPGIAGVLPPPHRAAPGGGSRPSPGGAAPGACPAPRLGAHNQLAQTPHTQAPAMLRAAQPIVRGRAPCARISYYGMEISQVQTARPGCECRCPPSVLFPRPQAALPSRCSPYLPRPSARGCPQAGRDPGAEVRAGESETWQGCVYVCVYRCVHLCVHVCICVYECCTHTPVCTHVRVYICAHMCCTHVHLYMRVGVGGVLCLHVHVCAQEYTCVAWYTHVYPCLCSRVSVCV